MKNNKNIVFVIIGIVIIAVIAAAFIINSNISSAKNSINGVVENYSKKISNLYKQERLETYDINTNLSFNLDLGSELNSLTPIVGEIEKLLNALDYNQTTKVDSNNNMMVEIIALINNVEFLNVLGYFKDNEAFMRIKDLSDKFVKLDDFDSTNLSVNIENQLNPENMEFITKELLNIFKDIDEKKYFTLKNNVNVEINDQKYNTTKFTLKNDEVENLYDTLVDKILENEKLLDALFKEFQITKDMFEELKDEELDLEDAPILSMNIFEDEIVKVELTTKDDEETLTLYNDFKNNKVILEMVDGFNDFKAEVDYTDTTIEVKVTTNDMTLKSTIIMDIDKNKENMDIKNELKIKGFSDTIKFDIFMKNDYTELKEDINTDNLEIIDIEDVDTTDFENLLKEKLLNISESLELEYITNYFNELGTVEY